MATNGRIVGLKRLFFLSYENVDKPLFLLKFIYSEKATKCCEIFTLLLTTVHIVKSWLKISQNFVAFSEYMIFSIYKEEVDSLDIEEIAKYFLMRNPTSQRIFGTFKLDQGSLLG